MTKTLKNFINTSIEKTYERPGTSAKVANNADSLETDDPALFISYIVMSATQRKKLAIEYVSGKGDVSTRLIEPHNWRNNQVVAWCHERGAWRQFKPSMIRRMVSPMNRSTEKKLSKSKRPMQKTWRIW
jgi:predicted DNA-binding transcriptional regulator YafY